MARKNMPSNDLPTVSHKALETTLNELAADIENAFYAKSIRVSVNPAVDQSAFDLLMTQLNIPMKSSIKVDLDVNRESIVVNPPIGDAFYVKSIDDLIDLVHCEVDHAV
jgi:hypothetical protein